MTYLKSPTSTKIHTRLFCRKISEGNNFIDSQDLREMGRDTFFSQHFFDTEWVSPASRQALKDRFPGHRGTGSNPGVWEPDAGLPWLQDEFKDSLG